MVMTEPVTYEEAGLARKATRASTSSVVPYRPSGTPCGQHGPAHVDVQNGADVVRAEVDEVAMADGSSVVDEDIETAQVADCVFNQPFVGVGIGAVCLNSNSVLPLTIDLIDDVLCSIGGAFVADGDVGAVPGECQGNCGADTARAARHQNSFALQIFHASCLCRVDEFIKVVAVGPDVRELGCGHPAEMLSA